MSNDINNTNVCVDSLTVVRRIKKEEKTVEKQERVSIKEQLKRVKRSTASLGNTDKKRRDMMSNKGILQ